LSALLLVLPKLRPEFEFPFRVGQDHAVFLIRQRNLFLGKRALPLLALLFLRLVPLAPGFGDDGFVALGCGNGQLLSPLNRRLEFILGQRRQLARPVGEVFIDALVGKGWCVLYLPFSAGLKTTT